jgi:bilin biosynthesis protein
LWFHLEKVWTERAHNDYGAHYLIMQLFGWIDQWSSRSLIAIREILLQAISDQRPQFKKSVPAAFLSLAKLFPDDCDSLLESWLSLEKVSSWQCRYVALMVVQADLKCHQIQRCQKSIESLAESDPEFLVRAKAQSMLLNT